MKTLEEKAQAYEKAIERAKITLDCCNSASIVTKNTVYDIFPELHESEDERIRKEIIWCLKHSGIKLDRPINPHVNTTMKDAIAWLEKQGGISEQWSEEDNEIVKDILYVFKQLKNTFFYKEDDRAENIINWIKSLKYRVKPQWKPSDEQMQVLIWCLPLFYDPKSKETLKSLIDDLKKL